MDNNSAVAAESGIIHPGARRHWRLGNTGISIEVENSVPIRWAHHGGTNFSFDTQGGEPFHMTVPLWNEAEAKATHAAGATHSGHPTDHATQGALTG